MLAGATVTTTVTTTVTVTTATTTLTWLTSSNPVWPESKFTKTQKLKEKKYTQLSICTWTIYEYGVCVCAWYVCACVSVYSM